MTEHMRALVERTDDNTGPLRFIASTEGKKRDGIDLKAGDWLLENFRANPVVLWGHDYRGIRPPIGRATSVNVEDRRLIADVEFDPNDEFARQIESKYRNGFLHTISVGWDTVRIGGLTKNDLLDLSAIPVPGDPSALMERQIRGIQAIDDILHELTDEPDDPPTDAEAVWAGTALSMARLFLPDAHDAFDERAYRRLCRTYQRLGKTPPERPDHLDALGVTEIRGLFLAGEPDLIPELFAAPAAAPIDAWWS